MIDATFLTKLAELAQAADKPKVHHPAAEPDHIYVIQTPEGPKYHIASPHPREHTAADLTAIAAKAAESIKEERFPEIWYSRDGVTLFIDGSTRRDQVQLPLKPSPQLARLMLWESARTTISQSELILTLRTLFRDCVNGLNLTDIIRRIKTQVNTSSDVKRTGVSLGKSIEAQLSDQASIPDYVTFEVPVFAAGALAAITASVSCAFEFDAEKSMFMLIPVPGQIEAGFTKAESMLGQLLHGEMPETPEDAEGYGLYYGKP